MEARHGIKWKYNINETLYDKNLVILDRKIVPYKRIKNGKEYVENHKYYKYKCLICGWDNGWMNEYNLVRCSCACCAKIELVKNINSLGAVHPELIKYFENSEDAYNVFPRTTCKKVSLKCPECGERKFMTPDKLTTNGFSCNKCNDNISYPEKFFMSVLEQLNINYIYQLSKNNFDWCKNYRYDFYLIDYGIIVETNGKQHYDYQNIAINDIHKKNMAYLNGFNDDTYIILDCSYSNTEWIKSAIKNSRLGKLFDLEKLDWNICNQSGLSSLVRRVCEFWESHKYYRLYEMSSLFHIERSTIRRYLLAGNEIGWCNYSVEDSKEGRNQFCGNLLAQKISIPISVYKDGKHIGNYPSAKYLSKHSEEILGVKLNISSIRDVCNGICHHHKGYYFKDMTQDEISLAL